MPGEAMPKKIELPSLERLQAKFNTLTTAEAVTLPDEFKVIREEVFSKRFKKDHERVSNALNASGAAPTDAYADQGTFIAMAYILKALDFEEVGDAVQALASKRPPGHAEGQGRG